MYPGVVCALQTHFALVFIIVVPIVVQADGGVTVIVLYLSDVLSLRCVIQICGIKI